jgi:hypothetical protein
MKLSATLRGGEARAGLINYDSMSHGNSKENQREHHLYGIKDRERRGIYKYGICGRPLNEDGSSPRAEEQVRLFNKVVGWAR